MIKQSESIANKNNALVHCYCCGFRDRSTNRMKWIDSPLIALFRVVQVIHPQVLLVSTMGHAAIGFQSELWTGLIKKKKKKKIKKKF